MKEILCILFLLLHLQINAQQNKIKVGIAGLPMFQSGFGMGNVGYERLNKNLNTSWQILYAVAGGSPAADAAISTRKWLTIERLWYFKPVHKKISYYYSFFSEAGIRKTKPGHAHYPDTAWLKETKVSEINPGASLGIVIKLGRKICVESAAGPKLIFQSGKEYYRNYRDNYDFTEPYKDTKLGLRFLFSFSYQF